MTVPTKQGLGALTEKEKQTLRLIVRGHDAKSIARTLDLSVHTVNERLREARRKAGVSSSREAARLLFESEDRVAAPHPESLGDSEIGDGARHPAAEEDTASIPGAGRRRRPWSTTGAMLMLPALALLGFAALAQLDPPPVPAVSAAGSNPAAVEQPAAAAAAQRFLTLIDQARWDESFAAAGASFRKVNTVERWADASRHARASLGAVIDRTVLSADSVAAPPHGYTLVKFRTQFANRPDVIEAVTLDREQGDWRVVGIVID